MKKAIGSILVTLLALDGGLLFWLLNYLYGASGSWQRGIALLMVIVDFIGAVAMFTLDTLYNTGAAGLTSAMGAAEIQTAVLALSGIIAINVGATVAHHLTDPENRKRQAAEEAQDEIEDMTIKKIAESSRRLAGEIAPHLAADWIENTKARYIGGVNVQRLQSGKTSQPVLFGQNKTESETVPLSNNGHNKGEI